MNRFAQSVVLFALLCGCASKPLNAPPSTVLQDPLPGLAIVYILRVPHDSAAVEVSLNDVSIARLPAETYTAISLRPGTYKMSTLDLSGEKSAVRGEGPVFSVFANERRFLYTSVPTTEMERPEDAGSLALIFIRHGAIPLPISASSQTHVPATIHRGPRAWYECSELDAQGLMSIGHVVMPDRQLL